MNMCPSGHQTAAVDFCEVCGMELETFASTSVPQSAEFQSIVIAPPQPPISDFLHPRSPLDKMCPICTTPRNGIFCELCGYNFSACQAPVESETIFPPQPVAEELLSPEAAEPEAKGIGWEISLEPQTMGSLLTARAIPFQCSEMVIGRSSKRNPQKPDIDLYGDDSVSHRHAILRVAAGEITLTDLDSANGTLLNKKPLQPHKSVSVQPGDRITVGVQWFLLLKTLS